jgi:hypothetical protein
MTEPEAIRVFVNGAAQSLARGATILDAVRAFSAAEADEIAAGTRAATDSRGLPVAPSTLVSGGMVLRVVSARALRNEKTEETA